MRTLTFTLLALACGSALASEKAPEACPWSHNELQKALAADMKPGKASERPWPGGRQLACDYAGKNFSDGNLHVIQTWVAKGEPPAGDTGDPSASLETIKGDPDHAAWVVDPYAGNKVTLEYVRGNVRTEVRLLVGMGKPDDLRARLLALRRVP